MANDMHTQEFNHLCCRLDCLPSSQLYSNQWNGPMALVPLKKRKLMMQVLGSQEWIVFTSISIFCDSNITFCARRAFLPYWIHKASQGHRFDLHSDTEERRTGQGISQCLHRVMWSRLLRPNASFPLDDMAYFPAQYMVLWPMVHRDLKGPAGTKVHRH